MIHTVGPIWRGGGEGEADLLAACYKNSLLLASEYGINSIAFPAISTGVYGYPGGAAAAIAVTAVAEYLHGRDMDVTFYCFGHESAGHHQAAMAAL